MISQGAAPTICEVSVGAVSYTHLPHDTHFLNMPFVGVFSHQPDSLMGVAQRYIMVSVWHTVFQYGVCDALCVEPVCHIVPFVIHCQAYVSLSLIHISKMDGH